MESTPAFACLTREPILDSSQRIIADTLVIEPTEARDGHDAIRGVNTLKDLTQVGAPYKTLMINMEIEWLQQNLAAMWSPQHIILELDVSCCLDQAVLERCLQLQQQGFRFALHDQTQYHEQIDPSLQIRTLTRLGVEFIKLDVRHLDTQQLSARAKHYQFLCKQLVAMHVDNMEQYNRCKKIGFKLMQGYYFAEPRAYTAKPFNQDFRTILNLLNLLSSGEDIKLIEARFKQDPTLSFKLLRYINSAGFGLSCEIQSIRHAITVIGTQQLFKWLTMLMVTAGQDVVAPALIQTSIIRGRLMELLGHSYFGRAGQDNLFVIGVFSLLHVILQTPMHEIVTKVDLPDMVRQALLNRQGIYGPFLALTEACEARDPAQVRYLATEMFMSEAEVNRCHMAALLWADSISAHT